jgi:spermidine synthase
LPAVVVGPPTLAMGASFPLLQKVVLVDPARIGHRVAAVLLANIAGSALGAIVTGSLALTYLGTAGLLKAMVAAGGLFLLLAAWRHGTAALRAAGVAAALGLFVSGLVHLPDTRQLWGSLHGTQPQRVVVHEDASGVSLVRAAGQGATVFVNGIGQSWIPYGRIHTVLGALPAFVHPSPHRAALVGLGSGDTLFALSGRRELAQITSIEIVRPQLATLRAWKEISGYGGLTAILADPRITHVAGDGRAFIMRSRDLYDIIETDALRPTSAYSGNLYSVEYFRLLRSRLAPGGIAVTWSPTARVRNTFASVFPHTLDFGDVLLGGQQPILFDSAAVLARVTHPAVVDYYARAGIDLAALLGPYLQRHPVRVPPLRRAAHDLNEDLFPRDEFAFAPADDPPAPR